MKRSLVCSALLLTINVMADVDKKVAPAAPAKAVATPAKQIETNTSSDQLISHKSNLRIGFVNQFDIGQSIQGLEANQLIEGKYKDLGQKLQESGQKVAQAENELKSRGSMLSKDAFELEQKKFVKLKNDHQSKMEEYEVDLKSMVRQVTESVMKEFQQAVVEIATEENYDIVLDMDGKALFAKGNLNITPKVVQKMNNRRPAKTPAKAAPAA